MLTESPCALLAALGLFACGDCPRDVHGIRDGDTIRTTIQSEDTAAALGASGCGDLGDLPPGAILTSVASVVNDTGAEACFNVLTLRARTLTTGSLDSSAAGPTILRLSDGCTGQFGVYFQSTNPSGSFLDDADAGAGAAFWLVRSFQSTGDSTLCFPGAAPPPEPCLDAFTVHNVRE